MMLDAITPVDAVPTLQDQVYDKLKSALLGGEFQPGEPLFLMTLARMLGTSRMPVRDALNRLVAEQALVKTPDRMIRVAPFTREICEEHIRIRMHLEGLAVLRACRSPDRHRLVERLRAINDRMLEAADAKTIRKAVEANKEFHFAIYEEARYPQLLQMISHLWLRTGPFVATAQREPSDAGQLFTTGFKFHTRVIAAVAKADVRSARYALCGDIRTATCWLRRNYNF
ncbi:GntR family transcriptional regulator, partial [Rhodoplanes sp. SY1]|uniref:GntR family transcriptional regulator n=1 Tax=Rhodoplanes sp. SY1 TaxID=3166646 RepID=UPI0038B4C8BA